MKERDYSDLEGKEITYINPWDGIECDGIVVGCDFDIGISIVSKENPDYYVYCLLGPSAPNAPPIELYQIYPAMFYTAVRMIKKGTLDGRKLDVVRGRPGYLVPSASTCPFNQ